MEFQCLADSNILKINLADSHTDYFLLADVPEITFSCETMVVNTSNGNIEYQRIDLIDFSFEEVETKIEDMHAHFSGPVLVYDLNGRLISNSEKNTANSVNMSILPPGTYIIKKQHRAVKYTKK